MSKICRAPSMGANRPMSSSHSGWSGWISVAVPYSLRISGWRSNEQNIRVIRLTSSRWAAVSLPLPVPFSQSTRLGPRTRRESRPLGETLTRPSRAAVATKYMCWAAMNFASRSLISPYCCAMAPCLLVGPPIGPPSGLPVGLSYDGSRRWTRYSSSSTLASWRPGRRFPVDPAGVLVAGLAGDLPGVGPGPAAVVQAGPQELRQPAPEQHRAQVVQLGQPEPVRGVQEFAERGQLQGLGDQSGRAAAQVVGGQPGVHVHLREHLGQVSGLTMERVVVQQHARHAGRLQGPQQGRQQQRVAPVQVDVAGAVADVELAGEAQGGATPDEEP